MLIMNTADYISETGGDIEIAAPAKSDFFIDLMNNIEKHDAPFYYEKRKGDFFATVRVRPGFKKVYDAGGLFVYDSARKWIKLEFELTDLGYPSVVAVVTNGASDDSNGERLDDQADIALRIIRRGDHWALHYSIDGKNWKMVRYFHLKMKDEVRVGLEAQSPRGNGCAVVFTGFRITDNTIRNMRKGK